MLEIQHCVGSHTALHLAKPFQPAMILKLPSQDWLFAALAQAPAAGSIACRFLAESRNVLCTLANAACKELLVSCITNGSSVATILGSGCRAMLSSMWLHFCLHCTLRYKTNAKHTVITRDGPGEKKKKHNVQRMSYAHGCLKTHFLAGEERFAVEWDQSDDAVW
jgi:hypothetical protein